MSIRPLLAAVFSLATSAAVAADLRDDPEIPRTKGAAESANATRGIAGKYEKFNLTLWLAPDGRYVTEEVNGCSEGIFVSTAKGVWQRDGAWLKLAAEVKDAGGWAQPWEEPDVPVAEWLVVESDAALQLYAPHAVDRLVAQWNAQHRFPRDMAAVKHGKADDDAAEPLLRELLADRLFDEPVVARITHVAQRNSTPLDDSFVGFDVTIDRGHADGIGDRAELFPADAHEDGSAMVHHADEHMAKVRLYVDPIDANDADAVPQVGESLTTRSPHAVIAQPQAFRVTELRALPGHPGALPEHRYWQGRVATDGAAPTVGQRLWQSGGVATAKILDVGPRDALVLVRTCDDCAAPKVGSRLFDAVR